MATPCNLRVARQRNLKNANDAEASFIEFKFNETCTVDGQRVPCLVAVDDGFGFTETAWERLTTIASGNPDVNKVGGFGVGFYSVFSVSERPTVKCGDTTMSFKWEGDDLHVDRYDVNKDAEDGEGGVAGVGQKYKGRTVFELPLVALKLP